MGNFTVVMDGQVISANGATALAGHASNMPDAVVDNRGSEDIAVKFGFSDVTVAFATGLRIPAGAMLTVGKGRATHVAIASRSGAGPSVVLHYGDGQ